MKNVVLLLCLGMWFASHAGYGRAVYDGKQRIEISGTGNTLSSVADDVGSAGVFSYDDSARKAVCRIRELVIVGGGELIIGDKNLPGAGETLVFECATGKGEADDRNSYRFDVDRNGTLNIYHSRIEAVNGLINDSKARHAGISYLPLSKGEVRAAALSGAYRFFIGSNAEVDVDGLTVDHCVYGISLHGIADGAVRNVTTANCRIGANLRLQLQRDESLKLVSCHLEGNSAAVALRRIDKKSRPIVVTLVDCRLAGPEEKRVVALGSATDKIGVAVAHSVKITLRNAEGAPQEGTSVSATVETEAPAIETRIAAVANKEGSAWLTVPEQVRVYSRSDAGLGTWREYPCTSRLVAHRVTLKDAWTPRANEAYVFTETAPGEFAESRGRYTAGVPIAVRNLISNSSFEVTGFPGIADCWWPVDWIQLQTNGMGKLCFGKMPSDEQPLVFVGLTDETPHHGKYCMRIGPGVKELRLVQAPFYQPGGKTYTFSAYIRADGPEAELTMCRHPAWTFKPTREWKRYHFTGFRKRDFLFTLANTGKVDIYVDAVQLEEGDQFHPYVPDGYETWVY